MSTSIKIYDNRNNKLFDISNLVSDIDISSYIDEQPTKCTFKVVEVTGLTFYEGAQVSMIFDGYKFFKGYVFQRKFTQDDIIEVTAYDLLRYLKNKDTYVYSGKTSAQVFNMVCNDYLIKHKVIDSSTYACPARSEDNKTLYEVIQRALDQTLIHTQKRFIIRDNFGTLEHINVMSLDSKLFLGDKSGLLTYDYTTSIDKDTYNQIKLYRDNKTTGKRDVFIVNDTINKGAYKGRNLKEWGILQLQESVDENLNLSQIQNLAINKLKLYNNVKRTLSLECIGDYRIRAGSIFYCKIGGLEKISKKAVRLLVTECSHKISNGEHTMSLSVEVV